MVQPLSRKNLRQDKKTQLNTENSENYDNTEQNKKFNTKKNFFVVAKFISNLIKN